MIRQRKIYEPVIKEYSRLAKAYDKRWAFYTEATTGETIKRRKLQPSDRLLDVGCGTGALLHRLSETHPADHLFGIDPVPGMLAMAKHRLPPIVELREGLAEQLPYSSGQFDVVICCNMFHYVREPVVALQEIKRVLRPSGLLIITDWCKDYFIIKLCNAYLRLFNCAHFRAYDEQTLASMLKENGYSISSRDRYKINRMWGLMTICAEKITA